MGKEFGIQQYLGFEIQSPRKVAMSLTTIEDKMQKNPLVIYHGNCADGFSAAWVFHNAQNKLRANFDFHPGVYNDPLPDVDDRVVYLVDFSYKKEVVKEICRRAIEVILIDHHKTAIDDLSVLLNEASHEFQYNFNWYVDIERSGAMLAWDYLYNVLWTTEFLEPAGTIRRFAIGEKKIWEEGYHPAPMLLRHIQDRDLWHFKLSCTREINAAVFSYEYTFENWDKLMLGQLGLEGNIVQQNDMLFELRTEGIAIERKHHKDIAELVKVCQRIMYIGGHEVPVASLPYTLSSDAGHLMAKEWRDGVKFAACYWDTPEHRVFSLRSTERGMDVSEIAFKYNGGGHKHAAGFRVPRVHILAQM